MQQFKIRQDGFKEIRKKFLLVLIPMTIIAIVIVIFIGPKNSNQDSILLNVLPIIPVVAFVGFGFWRMLKKQKTLFESYTLTITNNLIGREQFNTPTISIYFNDVKEITKLKNGCIIIKGKEKVDLIVVPKQIDDYARLEETLRQIKPFALNDKVSTMVKYKGLTGLLALGLMICVFTVNNKIVVGIAGGILIPLTLWNYLEVRKSRNIDNKTKRSSWRIFVVLAIVIAFMVLKLTGYMDI